MSNLFLGFSRHCAGPSPYPNLFWIFGVCALFLADPVLRFFQARLFPLMVTTVAPTADASKFFHLPSTAPALRREASPWAFLTSTMHAPSKGLSPVLLTILPTSCMFPGEIGKSVFLACSGLSLWWRMWLTPGGNKWHGPLNGYTCWKPLLYFFLLLHF